MNEPAPSPAELWWSRLQRLRARARSAVPFTAGVLAVLVALVLYNGLFPGPRPLSLSDVNDTVAQALASATAPPAYSAGVYQAILPSLVLIETQSADPNAEATGGQGSGVVIDMNGNILTSLHVVADAANIHLTFADGTEAGATIIAEQPETDIAVLAPNRLPGVLVPATLGNPNGMRVGDEAYVVGNPFGLYGTMTAGVISGLDRTFRPPNAEQAFTGLIQIDAAVNPGSSGGPLLNRAGQVIGIVTGLVNPTEQDVFIGIGFAVPINVAGAAADMPEY